MLISPGSDLEYLETLTPPDVSKALSSEEVLFWMELFEEDSPLHERTCHVEVDQTQDFYDELWNMFEDAYGAGEQSENHEAHNVCWAGSMTFHPRGHLINSQPHDTKKTV